MVSHLQFQHVEGRDEGSLNLWRNLASQINKSLKSRFSWETLPQWIRYDYGRKPCRKILNVNFRSLHACAHMHMCTYVISHACTGEYTINLTIYTYTWKNTIFYSLLPFYPKPPSPWTLATTILFCCCKDNFYIWHVVFSLENKI